MMNVDDERWSQKPSNHREMFSIIALEWSFSILKIQLEGIIMSFAQTIHIFLQPKPAASSYSRTNKRELRFYIISRVKREIVCWQKKCIKSHNRKKIDQPCDPIESLVRIDPRDFIHLIASKFMASTFAINDYVWAAPITENYIICKRNFAFVFIH